MATAQNPQEEAAAAHEEEEEEEIEEVVEEEAEKEKNKDKPMSQQQQPPPPSSSTSSNPFTFWFYTTAITTLLAILLSTLNPLLHPASPHSWFLSLPPHLHHHYSNGTFIKTNLFPNHPPTQVFVIDHRPKEGAVAAAESILLVHGLGCSSYSFRIVVKALAAGGFRAAAVDLPGSGFSDLVEGEGRVGGVLGRVLRVYRDVKEKGLFWGFDHLVEMGYVPYGEEEGRDSRVSDGLGDSGELGRVLGQLIDALGLAPVHVVAHDSAMGAVASWVSAAESGSVRSVTVVDSLLPSSAFPSWVLGVPVVREVLLGSRWAFGGLLRVCCSRSIDESAAEAYRVMLKREGRRSAAVDAGKGLNYSFDFGEWAGSEEVKDVPLQVLWSHMTSDLWIQEGKRVAAAVPRARFVPHLGGRWPQEGAAEEIAGKIAEFVSSLPKTHRQVKEESLRSQHKHMLDKADSGDNHQHNNHDHSHGHEYTAGYTDAYSLGHAWRS